jgi:hypothetical protein
MQQLAALEGPAFHFLWAVGLLHCAATAWLWTRAYNASDPFCAYYRHLWHYEGVASMLESVFGWAIILSLLFFDWPSWPRCTLLAALGAAELVLHWKYYVPRRRRHPLLISLHRCARLYGVSEAALLAFCRTLRLAAVPFLELDALMLGGGGGGALLLPEPAEGQVAEWRRSLGTRAFQAALEAHCVANM